MNHLWGFMHTNQVSEYSLQMSCYPLNCVIHMVVHTVASHQPKQDTKTGAFVLIMQDICVCCKLNLSQNPNHRVAKQLTVIDITLVQASKPAVSATMLQMLESVLERGAGAEECLVMQMDFC